MLVEYGIGADGATSGGAGLSSSGFDLGAIDPALMLLAGGLVLIVLLWALKG